MKTPKIIIKKVKGKDHGNPQHGSSWKVAYADFVTAMMAFFILLWLITSLSPEGKKNMAAYFQEVSILQNNGSGFMDKHNGIMGETTVPTAVSQVKGNQMSREEFRDKLKRDIERKLAEVKDQILVDIFEGGVRIQMIDKEGNPMFALGSPEMTISAKKIIKVIASNIKDMGNAVAIEGHTDALNYASNHYTNWELSTERASAARKELESEGLNANRLARVAGFAAKEPLIVSNPSDPRNRRISIVLLYNSTKDTRVLPLKNDIISPLAEDQQKGKPINPLGISS
jgi:chemotaxis protein MotB